MISLPRGDAWSGGQYSILRALLGLYLLVHFAQLLPFGAEVWSDAGALADDWASPLSRAFPNVLVWYSPPWFVAAWLSIGCALSVLLALGIRDRAAALALWYVLMAVLGRNPSILDPALSYLGWLLVAHAFVPRAPFLSVEARGRLDPDGGWRLPRAVHLSAWALLAVGYAYSGLTKLPSPSWMGESAVAHVLVHPLAQPAALREWALSLPDGMLRAMSFGGLALELCFAPLALVSRVRPWLWLSGLLMHLALLGLFDFAGLSLGMVLLHLFTFDPVWLPARAAQEKDVMFYDGHCGLCHRWVRFLLAEDRGGERFALSPLQGELIARRLSEDERAELPDSIVLLSADGRVLVRSSAILHILDALGGLWRILARLGKAIPRPLRDSAYDAIAALRHTLFSKPAETCPLLPAHLRGRFVP